MGTSSSSLKDLSSNEYLARLASTECLTPNDPFWNQLLSFAFIVPKTSADQSLLEESTVTICKNFVVNNCLTGNFGSLIRVFMTRANELQMAAQCNDDVFAWQTYNSLFIIRNLCKYFVENLTEEVLFEQFDAKPSDGSAASGQLEGETHLFDELVNCLMNILVNVPIVDVTYAVHLEAINALLTLLAIQLYQSQPSANLQIYQRTMTGKCSSHAVGVVNVLLSNYIRQAKCPPQFHAGRERNSMLYGLTAAVASGLWTVVTLGLANSKTSSKVTDGGGGQLDMPLANQSLLLMLVLTNHNCSEEATFTNPYREAFVACADVSVSTASPTGEQATKTSSPSPAAAATQVRVSYGDLYATLCRTLHDEQTTLLLYMLLHRVESVKAFVLSRSSIDQLVMPILKILYHAPEGSSHHIYMALIVILLLSEDTCFSKSVHEIVLRNLAWFRERQISEITLGGLLILVLVRTIQYNMARLRDQYLHTNCLAALANMSAQFSNLHPYVAQRLVSLFASLLKKYNKIVERLRDSSANHASANHSFANHSSSSADNSSPNVSLNDTLHDTDQAQELAVVEEVMRMMLEIFNSCLVTSLHHNPNLIYTMLYQRALFSQLARHPTFQDIVQNIELVLNYFSSRLEQNTGSLSVGEVNAMIKQSAVLFKRERLKKFAELKFRYVEEERPEEFFVPYVWSIVFHASNLYFNSSRVRLFAVRTPPSLT